MSDYSTTPNVLITSVGRRVSLVKLFQEATKNVSGGKVFTTDFLPAMSAACHVSEKSFEVPRVNDPRYLDVLLQICKDNEISLIVPTIDTELELLANVRDEWKSQYQIEITISDSNLVRICRNKRQTSELFHSLGIKSPTELAPDSTIFPRFIKPIAGSRSIDIHRVDSSDMMQSKYLDPAKYIQQELVDLKQYREFTVDGFYTSDGNLICLVPRERLEVRDGEVSKGRTHKGLLVSILKQKLCNFPGARGVITFQFFVKLDSEQNPTEILGIEINPRFGGGYPLTHSAGASYVDWLVSGHFENEKSEYLDSWQDQLIMLRYDAEIFI